MSQVADSDVETFVPPLTPEEVNLSSLRDMYTFFSDRTRQKLRQEADPTFGAVFDSFEQLLFNVQPNAQSLGDFEPEEAPGPEPEVELSHLIAPDAGVRSLRKRTFASRHPYVADKADYLGLCTIESINELFSTEENLANVLKVLNQLYLKKRQRYHGEFRYKAKSLYAHLGVANAAAEKAPEPAETQYQPSQAQDQQLQLSSSQMEAYLDLELDLGLEDLESELVAELDLDQSQQWQDSYWQNTNIQEVPPYFTHANEKAYTESTDGADSVSSSSDSDDSVEEIFSDQRDTDRTPVSERRSNFQGYAQESDIFNYQFARSRKKRRMSSNAGKSHRRKPLTQSRLTFGSSATPMSKSSRTIRAEQPKATRKRSIKGTTAKAPKTLHSRAKSISSKAFDPRPVMKPRFPPTPNTSIEVEPTKKAPKKKLVRPSAPTNQFHRRAPMTFTTAFEIESDRKFVRERRQLSQLPTFDTTSKSHFHILGDLPFNRIHSIGDGYIFFPGESNVSVTLETRQYTLTLVADDAVPLMKLLGHIRRMATSLKCISDPASRKELEIALESVVKWLLIRFRCSEGGQKILKALLDDFTKLQTGAVRLSRLTLHATLILAYYVLTKLYPLGSIGDICADFWSDVLRTISLRLIGDLENDRIKSIEMVIDLSSRFGDWWESLFTALNDLTSADDQDNFIEFLYSLCTMKAAKFSWVPFIAGLNALDNFTAHHQYLDVCELASQKMIPLEEKVVISFYQSLARRRFISFDDEIGEPSLLKTVSSLADIPNTFVFERFLTLVYNYVSALESEKDVKKLVSKVLSSSKLQYVPGQGFRAMFINRLSLILLITQISGVDLSLHFHSLIEDITQCGDTRIYGIALDGLECFSSVACLKKRKLPVPSFQSLIKTLTEQAFSLHGAVALLRRVYSIIDQLSRSSSAEDLALILQNSDMKQLPDDVAAKLLNILTRLLEGKPRVPLDGLNKSISCYLSWQMGKPSTSSDRIETTIKAWCKLCQLANDTWNVMLFQKFSFFGTPELRKQYFLFFCVTYLETHEAESYVIQDIDRALLESFIFQTCSIYTVRLYKILAHRNDSVFFTKKQGFANFSTLQLLENFNVYIISSVIQTIASSQQLVDEKRHFFAHITRLLKKQREQSAGSDYSRKVVELMHRFAEGFVNEEFWKLSTELGFHNKRAKDQWQASTMHGKIQTVEGELLRALRDRQNYKETIDVWVKDEITVVYACVETCVTRLDSDAAQWIRILCFLRYVRSKMEAHNVRCEEASFKDFINTLVALSSKRGAPHEFVLYEQLCVQSSCWILDYAYLIFSGYQDQSVIRGAIRSFMDSAGKSPGTSLVTTSLGLNEQLVEVWNSKREGQLRDQMALLKGRLSREPAALCDYDFAFT